MQYGECKRLKDYWQDVDLVDLEWQQEYKECWFEEMDSCCFVRMREWKLELEYSKIQKSNWYLNNTEVEVDYVVLRPQEVVRYQVDLCRIEV